MPQPIRSLVLVAFLLPAFTASVAAAPAIAGADGYGLQRPGMHHGSEVNASDGERWLALVQDAHGAALVEVVLSVEAVPDEVIDAPGEATGRTVEAPGFEDALVFVRGPRLSEGPVNGSLPTPVPLPPGLVLQTSLPRADGATLLLSCDAHVADPTHASCALSASLYDRSQVLARYEAAVGHHGELALGDANALQVLFAGDLDRDGIVDLIIDLSDHYNLSAPTLLLSSEADPGEVLRAVAVAPVTGC